MNNRLLKIFIAIVAIAFPAMLHASDEGEKKAFDPKEIIFEHLGDGYGWEVPFCHDKRIPLPVIVFGKSGFHCFSSARITHGQTYTDGNVEFRIAGEDSKYKGKVVEIINGQEYKPWDISITKNVCALFIAILLVIWSVLAVARWHKRHGYQAPRKFTGAIEFMITFIYDGVIRPTLGDRARKFAPYLLTVFFFILYMNLLGLIVIFPGGANLTGNIAVKLSDEDKLVVARARRAQRFLSQPFFVAEQFTGLPGVMVPISETIRGFKMILSGEMDEYPEQAFLNVGTIDEAIEKGKRMLAEAGA